MVIYRIILKDNIGLGRDKDESFVDIRKAEEFINQLPMEMTTCIYMVRSNEIASGRVFQTVERHLVWNNRQSNTSQYESRNQRQSYRAL